MTETKRAAIYVRQSSWRDDDPSTSPLRQTEACTHYCMARGWEYEVIEDLGESGSELGKGLDRPGLRRIRNNWDNYDAVVFMKLDRLARSTIDFATILREAIAHDVAVVSVQEGLDVGNPYGKFAATIIMAFAEMEAAQIRERTLAGKAAARRLGRWAGGQLPYGFHVNGDSALEVDDAEVAVLRQAGQIVLDGGGLQAAVRFLEESSLQPRSAEHWSRRVVKRALTSKHAAVIFGVEKADQINDLLWHPSNQPRTSNPTRLLSAYVHCSSCGSKMHSSNTIPMANGERKPAYRCSNRGKGDKACASPRAIASEPLDAWIEDLYLEQFGDAEHTVVVRASTDRTRKIAELKSRQHELEAISLDRKVPAPERMEALIELDAVGVELEQVKAEPSGKVDILRGTGRTNREIWDEADLTERRQIIHRWIGDEGLVIGPGKPGRRSQGPGVVERVLNRDRLYAVPADFAMTTEEVGEEFTDMAAEEIIGE